MTTQLYFLHAITSLHAGTGQGVDIIDLPIARERSTARPYVPGSSVKGVMAANCTDTTVQKQVYGPRGSEAGDHAGSVRISDARLLLFPVRSLRGTFAWTTSPDVLRRLVRDDFESVGLPSPAPVPVLNDYQQTFAGAALFEPNQNKVYLEDLDLDVQTATGDFQQWAQWLGEAVFPDDATWQQEFEQRFCLLHEDVFNFLHQSSTEVRARIALEAETKTVKKGGLWYEESLPPETVLSGLLDVCPSRRVAASISSESILEKVHEHTALPLQVGGKATVGRGLCRIRFHAAQGQGGQG